MKNRTLSFGICLLLPCAAFAVKGTWVVENGIRKFLVGRAPAEARAEAEAAYGRDASEREIRIEPTVSLDEVNEMVVPPGAKVLFRRGGVWRGQLQPRSGKPGHPVTYGAFGEGAKPVIQPSHARDAAADWTAAGDGLWKTETGAAADIGNIIFEQGLAGCAFKRDRLDELKADLDFWCDQKSFAVVLKSAVNPGERFRSVELCEKIHCIDEGGMHDVAYEGLSLRYTAAHGIGGADVRRIRISDCDVSWVGGGYLYFDKGGRGVRYGNGIEFWSAAEDILVENCRIWECWDAALTNQSNMDDVTQKNIVYRGNEVWNCEYSYEYWQQGNNARTVNVRVEGNVFRNAGYGWGHRQRWNPNAGHLMFYDTTARTEGFVIADNVFSRTADCGLRLFNAWYRNFTMKGNRWDIRERLLCRYHGRPTADLIYKYPDRLDQMHDDNQAEIESQTVERPRVFTPADLPAFLSFIGEVR